MAEAAQDAEVTACRAEQIARDHGFEPLAQLMCWLRLRCPYRRSLRAREVFLEQAYANIPVLVLASRLLHEHCQRTGRTRVLFLTRDGCVWQALFQALHPAYDTRTMVSSRRLLDADRPAYVDYFKGLYRHADSVMVDMHGTGATLKRFCWRNLRLKDPHVFVFSDCAWAPGPHRKAVLRPFYNCQPMEDLSADVGGSYVDLRDGQWVRAANEHPRWLAAAVAHARDVAAAHIAALAASPARGPDPVALIQRLLQPVRRRCRARAYFTHVNFHPRSVPAAE